MKRISLLMVLLALLASCARLPKIEPYPNPLQNEFVFNCDSVFPSGRWQVHHAIEATVPGGKKSGLMGVSVFSSDDRSIRCALMTIEGFVLFAGAFDGQLTIERAVGPFERPGFAQGLMADLMLLYFRPQGLLYKTGRFSDGERVCRYLSQAKEFTDVIVRDNQTWTVLKYSSRKRLERSIEARDVLKKGMDEDFPFANYITMKRHGLLGYQLDLRLMEAIALSTDDD